MGLRVTNLEGKVNSGRRGLLWPIHQFWLALFLVFCYNRPMIITNYGEAFVRLSFGDMVVAVNPISKDFDSKAPKFGANLSLVSLNHKALNGIDNMSFGNKETFAIEGPGEYEVAGVFIKGFESVGPNGLINTIYTIELEGMQVCHLGALSLTDLSPEILEDISGSDILITPIGDLDTLEGKAAAKFANSLEAKIIIPVLAGPKNEHLKAFLQEAGATSASPVDKLAIKRKDLEGKQGEVVVLSVV